MENKEREIEYLIIDNKKYEIVIEKKYENTTYLYLSNIDDEKDNFIRKYTDGNEDTVYPLDDENEFELAMSLLEIK